MVLHAIVAKDGGVKELEVISGPPLLATAATDAVKQWKYQPTLLNGQPVEVDTTITVNFDLVGLSPSSAPSSSSTSPSSPAPNDTISVVVIKPSIDPQLKANILKLLDLTHAMQVGQNAVRQMFQQMRPSLVASLPATPHRDQIVDTYGNKLFALINSQEVTDRLAVVYAKYLSADDVNAMILFYQTPSGQHSLSVMPQIITDSGQVGSDLVRENLPRIFQELCREYPELQGKVQFCTPASPKESSGLVRKELNPAAAAHFAPARGAQ